MKRFRHWIALYFLFSITGCMSTLPELQKVDENQLLDQNWSAEMRQMFYYTPQGTRVLPYDWFVSLEQPTISFFSDPELLSHGDYLARIGFIPDTNYDPKLNPDNLPIGFALDPDFTDPSSGTKMPMLGLTCAACHTAELHFKKNGKTIGIRIEGGPAMTHLADFQKAVGLSVAYTYYVPGRFDRFAKRVLKTAYTKATASKLKASLKNLIDAGIKQKEINDELKLEAVEGGFARTDALGRILNQVFGWSMNDTNPPGPINTANLSPLDAPVNYPHIWDSSWFDWVQYNASIHQPMIRNAGEALGVQASVNLRKEQDLYKSTVQVRNLFHIEQWLAGEKPFSNGLMSPKWPIETLGQINPSKAEQGKDLYDMHCQGCHLPPMTELKKDLESGDPKYWTKKFGPWLLHLNIINIDKVGTDRTLLDNFNTRVVKNAGVLEKTKKWIPVTEGMSMGPALGNVVENVNNYWYDANNIPPKERDQMNGYRKNLIQAPWGYKARPLNGVWATAPFLHNGSVPNLYELLSPVDERSKTFFLGSKEFDPVNVGFNIGSLSGGFKLDTSIKGSSNSGHEFNDGEGQGIIGPKLTQEERLAVIEYLKTL